MTFLLSFFISQFLLLGLLTSSWLDVLSALKSEDEKYWVSEVITSLFKNKSIFSFHVEDSVAELKFSVPQEPPAILACHCRRARLGAQGEQ